MASPVAALAGGGAADEEEADAYEAQEQRHGASWDWVYDDEMVRQERAEAEQRAAKSRLDFETTTKNAACIRTHLSKLIVDRPPQGEREDFMSHDGHATMGSRLSRSAGALPEGNMDHRRTTSIVADKMARTQDRWSVVASRRLAYGEEEARRKDRICSTLAAAEARTVAQQLELVEAQRKRAFNSAQRRSEQQKTLKEMRREKDRIWEAYYVQSHANDKESASMASSRSASPDRSPGRSLGGSSPSMLEPGDDDIYRSTMRSHQKYAVQMDQWRQFVVENERRTESQWKKILQGATKADLLGETPGDRFRKKTKVLRNTDLLVKACMSGRDRADEAQGQGASERQTAADERTFWTDQSPGCTMSSLTASKRSQSSPWSTRMELCRQHTEAKDLDQTSRREHCERRLLEARERGAARNREVAEHFREHCRRTQQRVDAASAKRSALEAASDEGLVRKQAAVSQRIADVAARMAEDRAQKWETKLSFMAKCKQTKEQNARAKSDAAATSLLRLDVAAAERAQLQEDAERKRREEEDSHAELSRQAIERRDAARRAIIIKTKREIATKNERSQRAMTRHKIMVGSVIEKERALRRERSAPVAVLAASGKVLPLLPEPVPMSPIQPPARRPDAVLSAGGAAAASDSDESEAQGEAEFLKELGSRSGQWLQELRRQKKTCVGV